MKYEEAKEKFISAWGTLGSSWGVNRTMAQIHALLLISTQPMSAEEIMEELKISRGNANMNLRALMDWGIVEKEFVAGERKEYFKAGKEVWDISRQIAMERKKRELDPVIKVLETIKEVEGNDEKAIEFKRMTAQLNDFAREADSFLGMFINSKQNWFYKILMKLKS